MTPQDARRYREEVNVPPTPPYPSLPRTARLAGGVGLTSKGQTLPRGKGNFEFGGQQNAILGQCRHIRWLRVILVPDHDEA